MLGSFQRSSLKNGLLLSPSQPEMERSAPMDASNFTPNMSGLFGQTFPAELNSAPSFMVTLGT